MSHSRYEAAGSDLAGRIEEVMRPEVVVSLLRAYVSPRLSAADVQTRVVQFDGTGAATLQIDVEGHGGLYAKLFRDRTRAARVYEKIVGLRSAGLGAGARYQAVEPLAVAPNLGMMLTRAAEGVPVSDHIRTDDPALLDGVRHAAAWLARLHRATVRVGPPLPLLASGELLPLAGRLAKSLSRSPAYTGLAIDMVRTLEGVAEHTAEGLLVQTHGQYRPFHVFVDDSTVSVIDLDRTRPSDPSRDVAEFVSRMRAVAWKTTGAVAWVDGATDAFVRTYADEVGDRAYLTNFRFHWARQTLRSLSKQLKDMGTDGFDGHPKAGFARAEFQRAVAGSFGV
jgi:hypothetical protein